MASTLNDLKLVHVVWDGDEGLVSLRLKTVLCYAYGHDQFIVVDDEILTATIHDTDFGHDEPTWDQVPGLLRARPELIDRPQAIPAAEGTIDPLASNP